MAGSTTTGFFRTSLSIENHLRPEFSDLETPSSLISPLYPSKELLCALLATLGQSAPTSKAFHQYCAVSFAAAVDMLAN